MDDDEGNNTNINKPELLQTSTLLREVNFGIREGLSIDFTSQQAIEIVAKERGIAPKDVIDTAETPQDILIRQENFIHIIHSKLLLLKYPNSNNNNSSTNNGAAEQQLSTSLLPPSSSFKAATVMTPSQKALTPQTPRDTKSRVLVVTHGGYIRRFLANFCQNGTDIKKIENCSISAVHVSYDIANKEFTCFLDASLVNYTRHLMNHDDDIDDNYDEKQGSTKGSGADGSGSGGLFNGISCRINEAACVFCL